MTARRPALHFVGFRDDRWWNALRVFGPPYFIHPIWDQRARREIAEGDTIFFAIGDVAQLIARHNAPDFIEDMAERSAECTHVETDGLQSR